MRRGVVRRRLAALVPAALLVLLTGTACAGSAAKPATASQSQSPTPSLAPHPSTTSTSLTPTAPTSSPSPPCTGAARPRYQHVVWIWMENRTYESVVAGSSAPNLLRYARECGLATRETAVAHGSLPNYLAATSGAPGVTGDCEPNACPQNRPSLFGQITAAGKTWRGYAEGMSGSCDLVSHDRYAVRHNPAVYYTPIRTQCRRDDVSFSELAPALAANDLPDFSFVAPDLCDDGHDCSTSTADRWLGSWLDRIVASPAYQAGTTVVFVTWDEGVAPDEHIATVVIAPSVRPGTRSATPYSHYSLLRAAEELLDLPLLGAAQSATSMRRGFNL